MRDGYILDKREKIRKKEGKDKKNLFIKYSKKMSYIQNAQKFSDINKNINQKMNTNQMKRGDPTNKMMNQVSGKTNSSTYNFSSPLNYYMGDGVLGSYDNLRLKTTCGPGGWAHPPCNPPVKSNLQTVPIGTPLPLRNEEIYSELPRDSMFLFARSYASPDCCPATFSTDRGCICSTQQMKALVGERRGNNQTYNNYNF